MAEIFKIEYDDKEARIFLKQLGIRLKEVQEPLKQAGNFMITEAIKNFPAKGQTFEESWPDWSESTRRVRAGEISFRTVHKPYKRVVPVSPRPEDKGGKLMEKTGRLRGSFRIFGPIVGKNTGSIEVYNPVEYAKYHQFGAVLWTGAKLPRRVLLKIAKRQIDKISQIFSQWLNRVLR